MPSQPPNWMVTEPSASFFAVRLVERIGIELVEFEEAFRVVDTDGPEAINRHVLDAEPVYGGTVILGWRDSEIKRVFVGISSPACSASDQVPHGVDLVPRTEHALGIRNGPGQYHQRFADFLLTGGVPVWDFELARSGLLAA